MYKIIALMGEAGAGKDTIFQSVLRHFENNERVHEIISCTSRPIRENETNGKNYHFYTASQFSDKIMSGQMFEYTTFNNWWYGTSNDSIKKGDVINIGVFNPDGVRQLLGRSDCAVTVYHIKASDKNRLMRQLTREYNPNVDEILRRFTTDRADFQKLPFDAIELPNDSLEDFNEAIAHVVSQVQAALTQGQN